MTEPLAARIFRGEKEDLASDPLYQSWQRVATEMGLREVKANEPDSSIVGTYRSYDVEIAYYHTTRVPLNTDEIQGEDDSSVRLKARTIFRIKFRNPFDVDFRLVPEAFWTTRTFIYHERFRINNPGFENECVTGNNGDYIKAVFDPDICTQILKLRQQDSSFSIWTTKDAKGWRLGAETYSHIRELKRDAERFRFILDVMVNLAEKVERNPSLATPHTRELEEQEFDREFDEELARREAALSRARAKDSPWPMGD